MATEFTNPGNDDQIKAENDFLKMKLMLERGAQFEAMGNEELPAEIENEFLKNIIEFERQFDLRRTIRIYDKIQQPNWFRPANEIPDDQIEAAWRDLTEYLNKYSIYLEVCSPNISKRELYRFAIEELFDHVMEDMDMPGWTYNFIYDEFHPDPVHDNSHEAKTCIQRLFNKEPLMYLLGFWSEDLVMNGQAFASNRDLMESLNRFKDAYDNLALSHCEVADCVIDKGCCEVTGHYKAEATLRYEKIPFSGNWKFDFRFHEESGYWYIHSGKIEGIRFS